MEFPDASLRGSTSASQAGQRAVTPAFSPAGPVGDESNFSMALVSF
jgi:hypothetical protein